MKKFKSILTFCITLILITTVLAMKGKKVLAVTEDYNFNNFTYKSSYGLTYNISNGTLNVNFQGSIRKLNSICLIQ